MKLTAVVDAISIRATVSSVEAHEGAHGIGGTCAVSLWHGGVWIDWISRTKLETNISRSGGELPR